jgi:hypothetical protein
MLLIIDSLIPMLPATPSNATETVLIPQPMWHS